MSDNPQLKFHLELPETASQTLLSGYLLLKTGSNAGIKLAATSGCRGAPILSLLEAQGAWATATIKRDRPKTYSVSTQRLWLPNVKGVEGSFYAISPFSVSIGGLDRGDFGIHFDANVPGSAGCCVLPIQSHWDTFRSWIAQMRTAGYQQVPLVVVYS